MRVLCKYYTNSARLALALKALSDHYGFQCYCLQGGLIQNKNGFKFSDKDATVIVTCINKDTKRAEYIVLTTNSKLKENDGTVVDLDNVPCDEWTLSLLQLLKQKYNITKNPFTVEFAGNKEVLALSPLMEEPYKDSIYEGIVRGISGEAMVRGDESIKAILPVYSELRAFRYTAITPEVEKEISVKKNRGEILREISHYLNRTLMLVSIMPNGSFLEQYISNIGILEVTTSTQGFKVYKKISPIVLHTTKPFCVQMIASTVDDIAKDLGRLLRKV